MTPYFETGDIQIYHGDAREVLADLEVEATACVTDPPYGLGDEPDPADVMRAWANGMDPDVGGGGFMREDWDSFVPAPNTFEAIYDSLLPGAPMLCFAGSRTADWMGMSLRFAGFERRDTIQYLFGSGFPKSHDISKAIDDAKGAEREVVGKGRTGGGRKAMHTNDGAGRDPSKEGNRLEGEYDKTAPATDEAKKFDGYGTALAPAHEPVILAMKPKDGTFAENALEHGTAGLNIDAARVSTTDNSEGRASPPPDCDDNKDGSNNDRRARANSARAFRRILDSLHQEYHDENHSPLPPNASLCARKHWSAQDSQADCPDYHRLCDELARRLEADDQVTETLSDDVRARIRQSERSGDRASKPSSNHQNERIDHRSTEDVLDRFLALIEDIMQDKPLLKQRIHGLNVQEKNTNSEDDTTRPSGPNNDDIYGEQGDEVRGSVDKGRWPANVVLDEAAAALVDQQSGASSSNKRTPTGKAGGVYGSGNGEDSAAMRGSQTADTTERGFNDAGGASRFFYTAKASKSDKNAGLPPGEENDHPTVKPTDLMGWLLRLVEMPERNLILDPFVGSGTTLYVAQQMGLPAVGIDQDEESCELASKRLSEPSLFS